MLNNGSAEENARTEASVGGGVLTEQEAEATVEYRRSELVRWCWSSALAVPYIQSDKRSNLSSRNSTRVTKM